MIEVTHSGSFKNLESFLKNAAKADVRAVLERAGQQGVSALSSATPKSTSLAANSWDYKVLYSKTSWSIVWTNSDIEAGYPVVIMLQYGHATGTGGYVQGRDFINPALKPIFDNLADDVWKAVTSK